MPIWPIVVAAKGALLLGGIAEYYLSDVDQQRRRKIRRTRCTAIASIDEQSEKVRVRGIARSAPDRAPLIAPITKRECIAWRVTVRAGPTLVSEEHECEPFRIVDGDEEARVTADDTQVLFTIEHKGHVRESGTPPMEVVEWLDQRNLIHPGRHGFLVAEGILEVGERVTAVGKPVWTADNDGYRQSRRVLRLEAPVDGPLLISDLRGLTR